MSGHEEISFNPTNTLSHTKVKIQEKRKNITNQQLVLVHTLLMQKLDRLQNIKLVLLMNHDILLLWLMKVKTE